MKISAFKIVIAALCLSLVLGIGACAKKTHPDVGTTYNAREISDPIEPVNRFVFGFNDILDRILIEPLAKGYKALFPGFARDAVQNFMHNLQSPLIVANNLLQGSPGDASVATMRFILNSTVGIGGLIDVAKTQGLSYENEDFGQTLATWGLGDGFYLVLPVLGPSSLRDALGKGVDAYGDPVRLVSSNADKDWIYYTRGALDGIDTRARLIEVIDDLRKNSLDYYAAARSTYTQKRASLIRDDQSGSAPRTLNYDELQ
jgi:phospholipid-binding lipoprotein MlaA